MLFLTTQVRDSPPHQTPPWIRRRGFVLVHGCRGATNSDVNVSSAVRCFWRNPLRESQFQAGLRKLMTVFFGLMWLYDGVATMDLWQSLECTWDAESSWFVFIQIPFPLCDITSMRDLQIHGINIFQTRVLRWSWLSEGTCDAENHGHHDPKLSWYFPGWFLIQIFGDVRRT